MAKSFLKEFLMVKAEYEKHNISGDFNHKYDELHIKCLNEVQSYLYSYKWCKNNTDREIFTQAMMGVSPNKMNIISKGKKLEPATLRSFASRLSNRLYAILGDDIWLILSNSSNDEYVTYRLKQIIIKCRCNMCEYDFNSEFSNIFCMMIKEYISDEMDVEISKVFEISEENQKILMFLSQYSNSTIKSRLEMLDKKSLAVIYKVLTDNRYVSQRVDILEYLKIYGVLNPKKVNQIENIKMKSILLGLQNKLSIKDEELVKKDKEIDKLKADKNTQNQQYNELKSEYERLKSENNNSKKIIADLRKQLAEIKKQY